MRTQQSIHSCSELTIFIGGSDISKYRSLDLLCECLKNLYISVVMYVPYDFHLVQFDVVA